MARPRFHNANPSKQDAILRAAAAEFARYGYEASSINRILGAAGLSKGAFYYYFDDKADLAVTVLQWAYRDVLAIVDKIELPEDGARFWDTLRKYIDDTMAVVRRSPHMNELGSRLGFALMKDKELRERVMGTFVRATAPFVQLWKRGQELGAVRDDLPVEMLVAIFGSIKEGLMRPFLPDERVPTTEEIERLAAIQLDLFRRIAEPVKEAQR
jgi:AcrR family transcriptional regulator